MEWGGDGDGLMLAATRGRHFPMRSFWGSISEGIWRAWMRGGFYFAVFLLVFFASVIFVLIRILRFLVRFLVPGDG